MFLCGKKYPVWSWRRVIRRDLVSGNVNGTSPSAVHPLKVRVKLLLALNIMELQQFCSLTHTLNPL